MPWVRLRRRPNAFDRDNGPSENYPLLVHRHPLDRHFRLPAAFEATKTEPKQNHWTHSRKVGLNHERVLSRLAAEDWRSDVTDGVRVNDGVGCGVSKSRMSTGFV